MLQYGAPTHAAQNVASMVLCISHYNLLSDGFADLMMDDRLARLSWQGGVRADTIAFSSRGSRADNSSTRGLAGKQQWHDLPSSACG